MEFRTFVEVQTTDGYGKTSWQEVCLQTGFLDGYCEGYDGYITQDFYVGLSNLKDGYFSQLFTRPFPMDISNKVRYKLDMLKCLSPFNMYYFYLGEINAFDWNQEIYASFTTASTTFINVAPDFVMYYIPSLEALGSSDKVRLIIARMG